MSHSDSVALLASILAPDQDAPPTLLLGAGASYTSGVPLAAKAVHMIAKRYYSERVERGVPPENIKPSKWKSWLEGHDWFDPDPDRLGENFPKAVYHLLRPQGYRKKVLLDLLEPRVGIQKGYNALANLVMRGMVSTVLTTNFDPCLPNALRSKRPHIPPVHESNRSPGDFAEFSVFNRAQIVWLHGKAEQYSDRNLVEETQTLDSELVEKMRPVLEGTPLVVIGYKGAEPSITDALLGSDKLEFHQGIFWCQRKGEELHPRVAELADRLGTNFKQLEIDSFDELLNDLDEALQGRNRYATIDKDAPATSFDDVVVESATWADIDAALALTTLRKYSERLGFGDVDASSLQAFMEDRGLLRQVDGVLRPTRGGILLFGRDTNRFFPHAVVTATVNGKQRTVIKGNLLQQHEALLQWLNEPKRNPILKVKRQKKYISQKAYHERALTELAVNLLVHRDYNIERAAEVSLTDRVSFEFKNPGGPTHALRRKMQFDEFGQFEPKPELTDLRNPTICDVFCGMHAMEQAGSGLPDVVQFTHDGGGSSQFAFPPGANRFVATVFQPNASAGSAKIAQDMRPVGIYTVNMLMFESLPKTVTCVRLNVRSKEFWSDRAQISGIVPCIFESRSGLLWTFASEEAVSETCEQWIEGEVEAITLEEMESDIDRARRLSWLLREHVEHYLAEFEGDGLLVERDSMGRSTRRAYFTAFNKGDRRIIYDTPKKKNNNRGVVKRRGDGERTFFECEGFGFEVTRIGESWALRIKPTYMFLGADGKTPLPAYLRTKLSTRRFKLDRNAAVKSDLGFFEQFLRDGEAVIDIGGVTTENLILQSSFLTIETEEEGMADDEECTKNRRSA